jgi:hypothetical protein
LLSSNLSNFLVKLEDLYTISIPELPPHRKQACFDRKRDFMMTNINFPVADIKFSISQFQKLVLRDYLKIGQIARQQK